MIEAAPEPDGSPGRPSPVVRVDDRHVGGALAIEIFVDEIGVAVVALDGSIVSSVRHARPAGTSRRRRDRERRRRTRTPGGKRQSFG